MIRAVKQRGVEGYIVECDVCGGGMDEDGFVGTPAVFCDTFDAGVFIDDNGWGQIGNYVACPDCVAKINRGEVVLKFENRKELSK